MNKVVNIKHMNI